MPKRMVKAKDHKGRKRQVILPNALQTALYLEVMESVFPGIAADYVSVLRLKNPDVITSWLRATRSHLLYLGRLGRSIARRKTKLAMVLEFNISSENIPSETMAWLGEWACLRDLVSPPALKDLYVWEMQERFKQLGTLDQNIRSM